MNPIDLYKISLYGSIVEWPRPAQGGCIGANAGERDVGRFGHIDAEDIDQFRDWLPQCLPRAMKEPDEEWGKVSIVTRE